MASWRDVSSYRRGEERGETPKSVEAKLTDGRLVVHRLVYDPGRWYVTFYLHSKTDVPLPEETTFEEAKQMAIEAGLGYARRLVAELEELAGEEGEPREEPEAPAEPAVDVAALEQLSRVILDSTDMKTQSWLVAPNAKTLEALAETLDMAMPEVERYPVLIWIEDGELVPEALY